MGAEKVIILDNSLICNATLGDIIKKVYVLLLFSLILFLGLGFVSASENITDNYDIGDLINECGDNGTLKLDEKVYKLNPEKETHLYLNKSISIEGTDKRTVIDGKNSTLYLDVEKSPEPEYNGIFIGIIENYDIKNTGKHIIFKNITFKDLNLISRHKMEFIDCKFINTIFTSKELNNTFDNCLFDKSQILVNSYDGDYHFYSKIVNCIFYNSTLASKTNEFIVIDGSSRIYVQNGMDLFNSRFISSDISLFHFNINMTNSYFINSNFNGASDIVNIFNSTFSNPYPNLKRWAHVVNIESIKDLISDISFDYSTVNFKQSNLNNSKFMFEGGFFNKGCEVILNNCKSNNSTFRFIPNCGSRQSSFLIENSDMDNTSIITTETKININDSKFNKTTIESINSNLYVYKSYFYNNNTISHTIKLLYSNDLVNTDNIIENSYFYNNTGKYKINNKVIINKLYKLSYNANILYCINDNITFNIKDYDGNPVPNIRLYIEDLNDHSTLLLITDEDGNANYTINSTGNLNLNAYYHDTEFNFRDKKCSMPVNLLINPIDIKFNKNFKSREYSIINSYLKVNIVGKYNFNPSGIKVIFKVFTNKKYTLYYKSTDKTGNVVFKIPKKLDAGIHKIEVIVDNKIIKTTSIIIQKSDTIVNAPKMTVKFKKSKYFKVVIKNKKTKKALSNVKVKIKIGTGIKSKTYIVKTNKNGMANINTKNLKIGMHKVVISSGNDNYKISAKSIIKIKK